MTAPTVDTPLTAEIINHLVAAVEDVRKLCQSEGNRWEGKHAATWQHWHARAGDMMTVSLALAALLAARREVEAARADAERWAIVQDRALNEAAATRRENEALRRALDSVRAEVSNGNRTAAARFGTVTAIVDGALAATPEEKNG